MAVCDYSGEFLYQGMVDAYGCILWCVPIPGDGGCLWLRLLW